MSKQSTTIISKVWGMCAPLCDDGVSYGDYLEQLTYIIFLKMSNEDSRPPHRKIQECLRVTSGRICNKKQKTYVQELS